MSEDRRDLQLVYEAAIAMQADLDRQEREALAQGDEETAAQRQGERVMLDRAIVKARRALAKPTTARGDRLVAARRANQDRMATRVARAAALRADGLSAAQIGMHLARELGHPDKPISERQVRRWLRAPKG